MFGVICQCWSVGNSFLEHYWKGFCGQVLDQVKWVLWSCLIWAAGAMLIYFLEFSLLVSITVVNHCFLGVIFQPVINPSKWTISHSHFFLGSRWEIYTLSSVMQVWKCEVQGTVTSFVSCSLNSHLGNKEGRGIWEKARTKCQIVLFFPFLNSSK